MLHCFTVIISRIFADNVRYSYSHRAVEKNIDLRDLSSFNHLIHLIQNLLCAFDGECGNNQNSVFLTVSEIAFFNLVDLVDSSSCKRFPYVDSIMIASAAAICAVRLQNRDVAVSKVAGKNRATSPFSVSSTKALPKM